MPDTQTKFHFDVKQTNTQTIVFDRPRSSEFGHEKCAAALKRGQKNFFSNNPMMGAKNAFFC
jgi:hypothetical protein